jgi:hypothetical protein
MSHLEPELLEAEREGWRALASGRHLTEPAMLQARFEDLGEAISESRPWSAHPPHPASPAARPRLSRTRRPPARDSTSP